MTVTSVAVMTTKFLLGMCNCTIDSNVGMGEFFARAGDFALVWTRARAIARVSVQVLAHSTVSLHLDDCQRPEHLGRGSLQFTKEFLC